MLIALSIVAAAELLGLIALGVLLIVTTQRLKSTRRKLARSRAGKTGPPRRRATGVAPFAVRAVANTVRTADAIVRKQIWGVRSTIEDLAGWAQVERPDLAAITAGGPVVLMFSDIEGSTQLNESLGDERWVEVLDRHNDLVSKSVDQHHGYIVKNQGDGFMVAFADPREAVGCCVDVQTALQDDPQRWDDIRVRMGAHVGTSVRRGDDFFGRNVAMAARIADLASGGEILVSDELRSAAGEDAQWKFDAPRDVALKGLNGTQRVFAVAAAS